MKEIWKTTYIDSGYEVATTGKIRSKLPRYKNISELKPVNTGNGYYRVCIGRKWILVHRLVAAAFLDNPDDLPVVNHKDENPSNNSVDNLEWCTHSYNQSYSKSYKKYFISPDNKIVEVFNLREFCRIEGLNRSNLMKVFNGQRPHHKGWRALK